jgi:hypothetical protein
MMRLRVRLGGGVRRGRLGDDRVRRRRGRGRVARLVQALEGHHPDDPSCDDEEEDEQK